MFDLLLLDFKIKFGIFLITSRKLLRICRMNKNKDKDAATRSTQTATQNATQNANVQENTSLNDQFEAFKQKYLHFDEQQQHPKRAAELHEIRQTMQIVRAAFAPFLDPKPCFQVTQTNYNDQMEMDAVNLTASPVSMNDFYRVSEDDPIHRTKNLKEKAYAKAPIAAIR